MDSLPPWSLIEEMLRTLVLTAFAAALLVFGVTCTITRTTRGLVIGGTLALAAGLAAGNHFRHLLEWWPREAAAAEGDTNPVRWCSLVRGWHALLPVTMAGIAGGILAEIVTKQIQRIAGVLVRATFAAGCTWWLNEALPPFSSTATFAALFAGTALTWEALHFAASRHPINLLVLPAMWGAAGAAILILAHSARFSDLSVLMTTAICAMGLIAALRKLPMAALVAGPAIFLPALMLAGAANTFSEIPITAFALVAFAPSALWLLALPPVRGMSPRALAAAAILALAIPCAAAVIMATRVESLDYGE